MPKQKKSLGERLTAMAEDITVSGDMNYRGMALATVYAGATRTLTDKQAKDMERLLSRGKRLMRDLESFWTNHPELSKLADRAALAANRSNQAKE